MATWISEKGDVLEIRLSRTRQLIQIQDVHNWVGPGFAIFYLDAEWLMLADPSAKGTGRSRNIKAIELLRLSALEPLAEIFGDVLIVHQDEISFGDLLAE